MKGSKETTEKLIIITAAKTLAFIVIFVALIAVCVATFAPRSFADFCGNAGLTKTQAVMLEREYTQTKELDALYNAIEANINADRIFTSIRLIRIMRVNSDYADFCEKIDEAAVSAARGENKVYVANYDAYLRSQLVKLLYRYGNKDEARTFAVSELVANANIYSWEFGTYIECILDDATLTSAQKNTILTGIYAADYDGSLIEELINNSADMLGDPDILSGLDKALTIYQLIRIRTTQARLLNAVGASTTLIDADIETLIEKYESALAYV